MQTEPIRGYPQFVLRLPQDLKEWLKDQARANRRSLNSELLHRLEQDRAQQAQQVTA